MINWSYDKWTQLTKHHFGDIFGAVHIVLEIKDDFTLKVQCISALNRGAIFCIGPKSIVLKEELGGEIRILKRKYLKEGSKIIWRK
jgi:hypothetical protein